MRMIHARTAEAKPKTRNDASGGPDRAPHNEEFDLAEAQKAAAIYIDAVREFDLDTAADARRTLEAEGFVLFWQPGRSDYSRRRAQASKAIGGGL